MPKNLDPQKPTTKDPAAPPKKPRLDDEPQVVTRGRVSHIEFSVDQPEPMPVRPVKPKRW